MCFYIDPEEFDEGYGFVPCVALEGRLGRYGVQRGNDPFVSPWYWGKTLDKAQQITRQANEEKGLSPEDVRQIMESAGLSEYLP